MNNVVITKEQFLKKTNKEELTLVFNAVYIRAIKIIERRNGFNNINTPTESELKFYVTDKVLKKAIDNTLPEWKP